MAKFDKKEIKEPKKEKPVDVNQNEGIVYLPPVEPIKR